MGSLSDIRENYTTQLNTLFFWGGKTSLNFMRVKFERIPWLNYNWLKGYLDGIQVNHFNPASLFKNGLKITILKRYMSF